MRRAILASLALAALAACSGTTAQRQIGPDGLPLPARYTIGAGDTERVTYQMLDGLNTLRAASGSPQVQLDPQLTAAAATHARDMSVQNRPWHFGSDGSSPLDRARRVGFTGTLTGEVLSETYETETETLAAWMNQPDTRAILLDRHATLAGFAWHQEPSGKLWWTLNLGHR